MTVVQLSDYRRTSKSPAAPCPTCAARTLRRTLTALADTLDGELLIDAPTTLDRLTDSIAELDHILTLVDDNNHRAGIHDPEPTPTRVSIRGAVVPLHPVAGFHA
jgi:hypothetical protein